MGGFAKAIKGLGTIASVVAAPVTGGASLAALPAIQGIGTAIDTVNTVKDVASAGKNVLGGISNPLGERAGPESAMAPGMDQPNRSFLDTMQNINNATVPLNNPLAQNNPISMPISPAKQDTAIDDPNLIAMFQQYQQMRGF